MKGVIQMSDIGMLLGVLIGLGVSLFIVCIVSIAYELGKSHKHDKRR